MIRVERPDTLNAVVNLPASKSITNRLLIMQALSDGKISIGNLSEASDSQVLIHLLKNIPEEVNTADSGTACRFITAFLANRPGQYRLQGSGRMHQRPMSELVDGLRLAGAEIRYMENPGYLPLSITGRKLDGGVVRLDASQSSQFVSALLLVAPYMKNGLELHLDGESSSAPYVDMTVGLMRMAGIRLEREDRTIIIEPQEYKPMHFEVESDWSAASFWYEMVALSEAGSVSLKNLKIDSLQGDSTIMKIMKSFGVATEGNAEGVLIKKEADFEFPGEFEYDFTDCPDLVMPVAALCAVASVRAELSGVKNLRLKESNRLATLQSELSKTGARVDALENRLMIIPAVNRVLPSVFQAHDDHRILMSMAGLAMGLGTVSIDDPSPVSKSYPEFWNELSAAGFHCKLTEDQFIFPRFS